MVAPFDPVAPGEGGGGKCVPRVTYGKAVALAKEGCFNKKGDTFTTTGAVRLNGVDLFPAGTASAADATAAATPKIAIDRATGTLKSTGKVLVKAGNIVLEDAKLAWRLPKGGGELKDLAGNPATFDVGKLKVEILGMDVSGWVTPKLTAAEGIELPVHLELPFPFSLLGGGKITGDVTLRLNNAKGLDLVGAELSAKTIFLGIAEIRDFHVTYEAKDPFVMEGGAQLVLPLAKKGFGIEFGLRDGEFDYGSALHDFGTPGLNIAPFTFLRSIGVSVFTDPLRIAGEAVATGGPSLDLFGEKFAAATAEGTVSYTFTDPGVFLAGGDGFIFNVKAAHAEVELVTSGMLSLLGNFNFTGPGVELGGSVDGEVSLTSGAFNLQGSGRACGIEPFDVCVLDVNVLVSSKAAAGCADGIPVIINPFSVPPEVEEVTGGVAYVWDSGFKLFGGCDLTPYKAKVASAKAAGAAQTFQVKGGLPQVNVAIQGQGAPPRVTITGPNGESVTSPESDEEDANASGSAGIIGPSHEEDTTYAILPTPAAGTWTIDPLDGSAPIANVLQAEGLPEPKVKARVRKGKGRKRTLAYEVKRIPGQKVTFFEVGTASAKQIGTAKGRRGRIGFSPADGPRGRRTIEAHVESFDVPRDALEVATYKAPGPIKPAKPRNLRVRRKGNKALVSWHKAKNAKRYLVRATLRDGRRLAITTRKTRALIKDVPGIDAATVTVAGLKADNTAGKAAKARLKAKPKGKRKKKRRG